MRGGGNPTSEEGAGPVLEVDLALIGANYRSLRRRFSGPTLSAVVKNDGYGLGLAAVSGALAREGCAHFWVVGPAEARVVQANAPGAVVFAMHGLQGLTPQQFIAENIVPVLGSIAEVEACATLARSSGSSMPVAIQLDTGLGRLGLRAGDCAQLAADPSLLSGLKIHAWVSHLAAFDIPEAASNVAQRARMLDWISRLPPAPVSLAASSGVYMADDWHFDIARTGSALYGVQTSQVRQEGLEICYRLRAPVLRIAEMPAGTHLGYRGATRLERASIIATVLAGYGNGLPQGFARCGTVGLGQWRVRPVGGVAMNLLMLDITDLPVGSVQVGQMASLLDEEQSVDDLAERLGCAPNALLTQIGAATRRTYLNQI